MRPLSLLVVVPGVLASPPPWYNVHRFHAHTRLAANEFCSNQTNCSGCGWTKAVRGRSPGSIIKPHKNASSLGKCQQACCKNEECEAVIFRNDTNVSNCVLLNRQYNSSFAPSEDSFVANIIRNNSPSNCSNYTWTCAPVFEEAAERFASLGVKAYVRHSHTGPEGMLWPTKTTPRAGWHPLVQATNRSLPAEFLFKAHEAGIKVIMYHYMVTNPYWSSQRPDWLQRWPNGSAILWQRGLGLSPCNDEWQDQYIAQVLELVEMGADAFYFDEFPASWGGDWSDACKAKFKAKYGEEMPTELTPGGTQKAGCSMPVAKDARVLLLMSEVTQRYFDKLASAIDAARPDSEGGSVALISIYKVPKADDGNAPDDVGEGLFETTELVRSANAAAKTEMSIPARPCGSWAALGGDPFDEDILMSFGYALSRDAASGRPPHIWIPKLTAPAQARAAAAAMATYGAVANPDHVEARIPDAFLFNETYRLGAKLDSALQEVAGKGSGSPVVPLGWASVLFSEKARNHNLAAHAQQAAWRDVIFPALGVWHTLVRAMVPARIVDDWQVEAACGEASATGSATGTGSGGDGAGGGAGDSDCAAFIARHALLVLPPLLRSNPNSSSTAGGGAGAGASSPLLNSTLAALRRYSQGGGQLLQLPAQSQSQWNRSADRSALGAALLAQLRERVGQPPVEAKISLGTGSAHIVAYGASDTFGGDGGGGGGPVLSKLHSGVRLGSGLLVMVSNNFTWCQPGVHVPPAPAAISGLVLTVRLPADQTPAAIATDVVSGLQLNVVPAASTDNSTKAWEIKLPDIAVVAAVLLRPKQPAAVLD